MYSLVSRVEDKNHHGLAASQTYLPSEYPREDLRSRPLRSVDFSCLGRLVAPAIISCDVTICWQFLQKKKRQIRISRGRFEISR